MYKLQPLFHFFIGLNFIGLVVLSFYFLFARNHSHNLTESFEVDIPNLFSSPKLSLEILRQLDIPTPIIEKLHFNVLSYSKNQYSSSMINIKTNNEYCENHRQYFVKNPDFIFTEKNFLLDYHPNNLVRAKVVPSLGKDVSPTLYSVVKHKPNAKSKTPFRPSINIFFTNTAIYLYQELGKQFSCTTQISNHIPGVGRINRKDFVAESVVEYAKRYETRPQCFNFDKFFPKTWVLYHADQCQQFFEEFNSESYQREKEEKRIVYIKKVGFGAHKAKGVDPVDQEEEDFLRETYENGEKCGKVKKNFIIQTFIAEPLLLEGHKFDFRIYMLIASTNPTILFYHDGFLRLSLHEYDVNSNDKSVLLTNTDLSKEIFIEASHGTLFSGMNETELRNFQMWGFRKLHLYLMERNIVNDPNWLDNYLRPEFKKAMIHLVRMSEDAFLRTSSVYELFGADFMLDSKLNLWFIECNSSPVFKGTSEEKEKFLLKMLTDQFEIVFGLLKSRVKRIIDYVNMIVKEGATVFPDGEVVIDDLERRRQEFEKIRTNYYEPEFEPGPENGFSRIIDGNLEGEERYFGFIERECLN